MNRRGFLRSAGWIGVAKTLVPSAWAAAPFADVPTQKALVLYCDLAVDPAREQELLHHFHHDFKPAAEKFEGYIDLKIFKLRKVVQGGPAPAANVNYRFQLTYKSEELRQRWIGSEVHKKNWPLIENTVTDKGSLILLADNAQPISFCCLRGIVTQGKD